MPFSIRLAAEADIPALVGLMTDFYAESEFPLPAAAATRAFEALFAPPALGFVWVAEEEGAPVGHLVLALSFSMEYGGLRGFIDDLYVRPASRGQGAGAALLAAARDGARARGVRVLQVETGQAPHLARPLYARAGYADSGHALLTLPLASPVHLL
ncbi:MAG: GNAT family N-acetyltransferase [bacterium]